MTDSSTSPVSVAAVSSTPDYSVDQGCLWYFAIGSMINPVSMRLRNLFPRRSYAAELRGWKLVFRGGGGMGDIDQEEGASFHGVAHLLTTEECALLDNIEAMYVRVPVTVRAYDGAEFQAFVYKMDRSKLDQKVPDALPGERYLDIIARGARHYGVKPEYIEWIEKHPSTPRKQISQYRRIPFPPKDAIIPRSRLEAGTGEPGQELLVAINGKVLKFYKDPNEVRFGYDWAKVRYGGKDATIQIACTLYEPRYSIPTSLSDIEPGCRLWAEELFVGFTRTPVVTDPKYIGNWEVIGWLEDWPFERE